jgi:hypothetical protein
MLRADISNFSSMVYYSPRPLLQHPILTRYPAFAIAIFFILVRSLFRVAELAHGFSGKLANDQITFMVLEGGMMILATLFLTAFSPGRFLGRDEWKNSGWGYKKGGSALSLEKPRSDTTPESERLQTVPL